MLQFIVVGEVPVSVRDEEEEEEEQNETEQKRAMHEDDAEFISFHSNIAATESKWQTRKAESRLQSI